MHAAPQGFGIYVHVPWCRVRCPYCSFNVFVDPTAPYEEWAERIVADWRVEEPHFGNGPAHSLFFGGGTPSLAPPEVLQRVLSRLPLAPDAEVTVEANPGTITRESLADLRAAGVNRISLGLQTFNPRFARLLNRGHTVGQARALVELVASAGLRTWSIDIIFALPGQGLADFEVDLDAMLQVGPPHVSLYGLELHPGTPLTRAVQAGRIEALPPDDWRAQYDLAVDRLQGTGQVRYEVSNFARPGHRAVHNEQVWRGGHYAGLGPGAHGFRPDGARTVQPPELDGWLSGAPAVVEQPDPAAAAIDLVLTCLRHVDGLSLDRLASTGHRVAPRTLALLQRSGLLEHTRARVRLTHAGFPVADGVVASVCGALVPTPFP